MYTINSNLLSKSGVSAQQLNDAIKSSRGDNGFQDAQMFLDVESKYGINALFVAAHAAIESAWGTSEICRDKNNLFGFNAVDSDPYNQASSYKSQAESCDQYGAFLLKQYLTPGGAYYNGATPHGVFVKYSSSHDQEANSIVGIMNALADKIGGSASDGGQAEQHSNTNAGARHQVQSGETLSGLASTWGVTVDDIINANKASYSNIGTGQDAHLEAGWTLTIPGSRPADTASAPTDSGSSEHVVAPGENLTVIAKQYKGVTADQILAANQARFTKMTRDYIQAGWSLIIPGHGVSESNQVTVHVESGDYLSKYAATYGTPVDTIVAMNIGKYPNITRDHIEAGWDLRVK